MKDEEIKDYEESKPNYVQLPRKILSDYSAGKITTAERNLLTWLRLNGDPYGRAHVSVKSLAEDTFSKPVDTSYIRKLLGSLKKHKYIYFKDRRGSRGMFQVRFPEWTRPDGSVSSFESDCDTKSVTTKEQLCPQDRTIQSPNLPPRNHSSGTGIKPISSSLKEYKRRNRHNFLK